MLLFVFAIEQYSNYENEWLWKCTHEKIVKQTDDDMDWIGLDWLAGTGATTTLRIVHGPKPFFSKLSQIS